MTIPTIPSFSRSPRSGPSGKHPERISADVSESLLCDIADDLGIAHNETETGPVSDREAKQ